MDLWETMKRNSVCIMGIPKGEENEKGTESIFKSNNDQKLPK